MGAWISFSDCRVALNKPTTASYLGESNVVGVYAEALAAHVESVLADQSVLVGTNAAVASTLAVLLGVRVDQSLGSHGICR